MKERVRTYFEFMFVLGYCIWYIVYNAIYANTEQEVIFFTIGVFFILGVMDFTLRYLKIWREKEKSIDEARNSEKQ